MGLGAGVRQLQWGEGVTARVEGRGCDSDNVCVPFAFHTPWHPPTPAVPHPPPPDRTPPPIPSLHCLWRGVGWRCGGALACRRCQGGGGRASSHLTHTHTRCRSRAGKPARLRVGRPTLPPLAARFPSWRRGGLVDAAAGQPAGRSPGRRQQVPGPAAHRAGNGRASGWVVVRPSLGRGGRREGVFWDVCGPRHCDDTHADSHTHIWEWWLFTCCWVF